MSAPNGTLADELTFEQRVTAGHRLRRIRVGFGWSQHDLAARAGVSQGSVSKAESGYMAVREDILRSLAGAFGIPVSSLVGGQEASCG